MKLFSRSKAESVDDAFLDDVPASEFAIGGGVQKKNKKKQKKKEKKGKDKKRGDHGSSVRRQSVDEEYFPEVFQARKGKSKRE